MSKCYEKDANGKYHLVDKDKQEPQKVENNNRPLTLEELEARIKRLEG